MGGGGGGLENEGLGLLRFGALLKGSLLGTQNGTSRGALRGALQA